MNMTLGSLRALQVFCGKLFDSAIAFAVPAKREFDQSVNYQADPSVDQQSPVETVRLVARRQRKVWHQEEKVQQVANQNGGELFEDAMGHSARERLRLGGLAQDDTPSG